MLNITFKKKKEKYIFAESRVSIFIHAIFSSTFHLFWY